MRSPYVSLVAEVFEGIADTKVHLTFPTVRYADSPEDFAYYILGVDTLWDGQLKIFDSFKKPKSSTIVRAGTKVGKSFSIACLALWAYCTIPRANVAMTAGSKEQISNVLWSEISYLFSRSGVCADCRRVERETGVDAERPCPHSAIIDGHLSPDVAKGLHSADGRVIRGVTGNKIDAYQGISGGSRLVLIIDEATGVKDEYIAAFRGNLTGARFLAIANPNRTDGFFWECHLPEKSGIHTLLHLSTEEAAKLDIDGLATREDIERARKEYGEDSAHFQSKYLGEFPTQDSRKLISLHLIAEAVSRWSETEAKGRLHLGVDPAKYGDDDTAVAVRRGNKVLGVKTMHGLDEAGVAAFVMSMVHEHKLPDEIPIVKVDGTGQIGADVVAQLRAFSAQIKLVSIVAHETPPKPELYLRWRDQAAMALKIWLQEGGAIPSDPKLETELHAAEMSHDARNRIVVESKQRIKKRLKRSPDRNDSVVLACWDDPAYETKEKPFYSPDLPGPRRNGLYSPYARPNVEKTRGAIYGTRRR